MRPSRREEKEGGTYREVPSNVVYEGPAPRWRLWWLRLLRLVGRLPEGDGHEGRPVRVWPVDVVTYILLVEKWHQRHRPEGGRRDAVTWPRLEAGLYRKLTADEGVEVLFPITELDGVLHLLRGFGHVHVLGEEVWVTPQGHRYLGHRLAHTDPRARAKMAEALGIGGEDGQMRAWVRLESGRR